MVGSSQYRHSNGHEQGRYYSLRYCNEDESGDTIVDFERIKSEHQDNCATQYTDCFKQRQQHSLKDTHLLLQKDEDCYSVHIQRKLGRRGEGPEGRMESLIAQRVKEN